MTDRFSLRVIILMILITLLIVMRGALLDFVVKRSPQEGSLSMRTTGITVETAKTAGKMTTLKNNTQTMIPSRGDPFDILWTTPLITVDGRNFEMKNFKGKPVFVCFMDIRDKEFINTLKSFKENYPQVVIFSIMKENLNVLRDFANKVNWYVVRDYENLFKRLGVVKTPVVYVFAQDGKPADVLSGKITLEDLEISLKFTK